MFCDHLWATLLPQYEFLTWIGRISFPIFAFMITEGLYQTKDVKKYVKRLFIFSFISEIPFNLMYDGSVIYLFHQNVLWTFLMALLLLMGIDIFNSYWTYRPYKKSDIKIQDVYLCTAYYLNHPAWICDRNNHHG